jgi:enamine deaminase RidA (YjgF/YER057c/UK114 family)
MAMSPAASYPGDAVPIVDRLASVPDLAPGPGFAHAVTITGKLAFVSGQVAPNPASTLVQVAVLFRPEFLVEVEAVVAVGGQ